MKLFLSKNGLPVIQVTETTTVILSKSASREDGTKWIVICKPDGQSFGSDVSFSKINREDSSNLPMREIRIVRDIIKDFLDSDGYFPWSKLELLTDELEKVNVEPIQKRKRNKKADKKLVQKRKEWDDEPD